ncbi:hypothetical protein [Bauldia sp.]|uniref:hypothetical protein n=1 Tax=Bauldia sp. TaxID=2575872 RepID=UPI003BADBBD3
MRGVDDGQVPSRIPDDLKKSWKISETGTGKHKAAQSGGISGRQEATKLEEMLAA